MGTPNQISSLLCKFLLTIFVVVYTMAASTKGRFMKPSSSIKTKSALVAAMSANPTVRLRWNMTSSGKKGIYTFNDETVFARAAEAVILSGCVMERKRDTSWNKRVWLFLGTD